MDKFHWCVRSYHVYAPYSSIFHLKSPFTTCLTKSYRFWDVPEIFRLCGPDRQNGSLQEAARDVVLGVRTILPSAGTISHDIPFPSTLHGARYRMHFQPERVIPHHLQSLSLRRYYEAGYGVSWTVSLNTLELLGPWHGHCPLEVYILRHWRILWGEKFGINPSFQIKKNQPYYTVYRLKKLSKT